LYWYYLTSLQHHYGLQNLRICQFGIWFYLSQLNFSVKWVRRRLTASRLVISFSIFIFWFLLDVLTLVSFNWYLAYYFDISICQMHLISSFPLLILKLHLRLLEILSFCMISNSYLQCRLSFYLYLASVCASFFKVVLVIFNSINSLDKSYSITQSLLSCRAYIWPFYHRFLLQHLVYLYMIICYNKIVFIKVTVNFSTCFRNITVPGLINALHIVII